MYPPPGKRESPPREYFNGDLLNFSNSQCEYAKKNNEELKACFMRNFISVKPNLHIVVTIAQHACDRVRQRVLKLSTYQLQMFLVKYEYLRSSQLCEDNGILGKLKRPVSIHLYETRL